MSKIKTWIIIGLVVAMWMPKGLIDFSALSNLIPSIKMGELSATGAQAKFGIWSTCFFIGICFLGSAAQLGCFLLPKTTKADYQGDTIPIRMIFRAGAAILTLVGFIVWLGVSISELHGILGL